MGDSVEDQKQRFQRLKASVHEAVFESLRGVPREPWSRVDFDSSHVREALASHLTSHEASDDAKNTARKHSEMFGVLGAAVLRESPVLSRLKVVMGTELLYSSFRKALKLAETVRTSEEAAQRLRARVRYVKQWDETKRLLSDEMLEEELKLFSLQRRHRALISWGKLDQSQAASEAVRHEQSLALYAALSVEPALRAVIEVALDDEWQIGDGGSESKMVAKRLKDVKGPSMMSQKLVKEEDMDAMRDRAKALISLCENLKVEAKGELGGSWEEEMRLRMKRCMAKSDELKQQCEMGLEELQAVAIRVVQAWIRRQVSRMRYAETIGNIIKGQRNKTETEEREGRQRREREGSEEEERRQREEEERLDEERTVRVLAERARREQLKAGKELGVAPVAEDLSMYSKLDKSGGNQAKDGAAK